MNHVVRLADVESCVVAANFYDRYREPITRVETLDQRDKMMADMDEDLQRYSKAYPKDEAKLLETYQLLKRKLLEVLYW